MKRIDKDTWGNIAMMMLPVTLLTFIIFLVVFVRELQPATRIIFILMMAETILLLTSISKSSD